MPSAVIPYNSKYEHADLVLGTPFVPYIAGTNSLLEKCDYDFQKKILSFSIKAFVGHKNITQIICPNQPKAVYVDGEKLNGNLNIVNDNGVYVLNISFVHKFTEDKIIIEF